MPVAVARSQSAGLVLYRRHDGALEVMLVHMGGPFWARKDEGAWSIPKGEHEDGDDPWAVARREFAEELGQDVPAGEPLTLGTVRQSSGKLVTAFALEADLDVSTVSSNTFELEWPPRSGRLQAFPEVDRADWFDLETAARKLVKGQVPLLARLAEAVAGSGP
jgi:predicted NUDIX family NTP pyrophosphohydrolase